MRTCVNAASHGLNVISALHEQNLIGDAFLFLDPGLKLTAHRGVHVFGPRDDFLGCAIIGTCQ